MSNEDDEDRCSRAVGNGGSPQPNAFFRLFQRLQSIYQMPHLDRSS